MPDRFMFHQTKGDVLSVPPNPSPPSIILLCLMMEESLGFRRTGVQVEEQTTQQFVVRSPKHRTFYICRNLFISSSTYVLVGVSRWRGVNSFKTVCTIFFLMVSAKLSIRPPLLYIKRQLTIVVLVLVRAWKGQVQSTCCVFFFFFRPSPRNVRVGRVGVRLGRIHTRLEHMPSPTCATLNTYLLLIQ